MIARSAPTNLPLVAARSSNRNFSSSGTSPRRLAGISSRPIRRVGTKIADP
jgi:hypothetical protein